MLKVIKKDKSSEDFDRNKIINGITKAGGTAEIAEAVASEIESWIPLAAKNGTVSYTDLKYKVLEVLRSKDAKTAKNFENYKKK